MTPNTKRTILFTVLGLFAIGAGVAYYLYNKKPIDVEHATPDTRSSSVELYQAFSTDSLTARKKFSQKNEVVEVSGIVSHISKNLDDHAIILLKTNESSASVNCTMEGLAGNIKEADNVIIKGICTGMGMGDTDLGILGDVYLVRCYLVK